jgi:ABC-2 type transport system permease protein
MTVALLVFRSTLRGQRISIALMSVGLLAFAFLMSATFEAFGVATLELMESMPSGFQSLLKAATGAGSAAMNYMAIGYRHPVPMIVTAGFVVAASSGAMAKEIERGSIFLLLSRPVPRLHLMLAKFASMAVGLVAFQAFMLLGTWIGATTYGLEGMDYGTVTLIMVNGLFLGLAVSGITFSISAVSSDGGRAIALSAGILVVLFFVDFLAGTWSAVEAIGPISPFHYYDPVSVVNSGSVSALHLGVLAAFAVGGLTLAAIAFNRRDIP